MIKRLWRKIIIFVLRFCHLRIYMIFRHAQFNDLTHACEIQRVNLDNVDDALGMDSPNTVAQFREFFKRGDVAYYAYLNGAIVHYGWVQFGPAEAQCSAPMHGRVITFKLKDGEYYVHHCKTHPNARGQGIYPFVLIRIAHDMHAGGYRNGFIATNQSNYASVRGIEKAGFRLYKRRVLH